MYIDLNVANMFFFFFSKNIRARDNAGDRFKNVRIWSVIKSSNVTITTARFYQALVYYWSSYYSFC